MGDKIKTALSFTCNQNWDAMESMNDGKFCTTCQKKVYDLSDKNVAYFRLLLKENNNNICGKFNHEQILKPKISLSRKYWSKYVMAALIFVGFESCNKEVNKEEKLLGVIASKEIDSFQQSCVTLGAPMPPVIVESK